LDSAITQVIYRKKTIIIHATIPGGELITSPLDTDENRKKLQELASEQVKVVYGYSGRVRSRNEFKSGKLHGMSESFFRSGRPKTRFKYVDGRRHGVCIEWRRDGEKIVKEFSHGELIPF